MSALPLAAGECRQRPDPADRTFGCRLADYEARYRSMWSETSTEPPVPGDRTTVLERWSNRRHSRLFIDWLAAEVPRYPEDGADRRLWRQRVQQEVRCFGEERFGWRNGYRDLLVSEDFYDSTVDFVRRAREFDRAMSTSDISQALRNVWIVNSLQMFLERRVCVTPAAFAYSMLYPYTDNVLDDPEIPSDHKRVLNWNLKRWLAGEEALPTDRHQQRVRALVRMIEDQFDRHRFPSVYSSLMAIHAGQVESLDQQASHTPLGETELTTISVRKGGASVLADGYLAGGHLDEATEDFCMGYGVLLQLLDDLQDVQSDLEARHETLFTRKARHGYLDRLTSRLFHFIDDVLSGVERLQEPRHGPLQELIRRNCVFLLVGAVAANRSLHSGSFRRRIERCWPLSLRAMTRLQHRAVDRFRHASEVLCRAKGLEEPMQLLEQENRP